MRKLFILGLLATALTFSSYVKPVVPHAVAPHTVTTLKKIAGAEHFETTNSGTDVNTYYNVCSGEFVQYTETWTETTRGVINKNKIQGTYHYSDDIEGIGLTTGNKYTGHGKLNFVYNDTYNGAYTSNFVLTQVITTPGGGNNILASWKAKLTINANGAVVVDRSETSFDCQ